MLPSAHRTAVAVRTASGSCVGARHCREPVLQLVEELVERRLVGDTARAATSSEVKDLRQEARALKEVVASRL
jgi:hypothetical protein